MSTRSSIAMLNNDGTVHAHYCHSDGYLSWNGATLYEHYRKLDKVKELIALGDMSVLCPEVKPPEEVKHSYDERVDKVSVFYGRDRGEENVETKEYKNLEDYLENGNFEEYDYIFKEKKNQWYLIDHDHKKLKKLSTLLKNDGSVSQDVKNLINLDIEKAKVFRQAKILDDNAEKENLKKNIGIKL